MIEKVNKENIAGIMALAGYVALVGMPLIQLGKTEFYSMRYLGITILISAGISFLTILLLYAIIE